MRRVECDELIYRHLIIAEDFDIRAEFAEVLDEVVGKRVVVIYKYEHGYFPFRLKAGKFECCRLKTCKPLNL